MAGKIKRALVFDEKRVVRRVSLVPLHSLHPLAALAHEFEVEVVRDEEGLRGGEMED